MSNVESRFLLGNWTLMTWSFILCQGHIRCRVILWLRESNVRVVKHLEHLLCLHLVFLVKSQGSTLRCHLCVLLLPCQPPPPPSPPSRHARVGRRIPPSPPPSRRWQCPPPPQPPARGCMARWCGRGQCRRGQCNREVASVHHRHLLFRSGRMVMEALDCVGTAKTDALCAGAGCCFMNL